MLQTPATRESVINGLLEEFAKEMSRLEAANAELLSRLNQVSSPGSQAPPPKSGEISEKRSPVAERIWSLLIRARAQSDLIVSAIGPLEI